MAWGEMNRWTLTIVGSLSLDKQKQVDSGKDGSIPLLIPRDCHTALPGHTHTVTQCAFAWLKCVNDYID